MKRSSIHSIILLILLAQLIPSAAFGHGWAGYEQGAKARGMGGAFTGLADDPSAVYFNPAGIAYLDGSQASVGFAVATIRGRFESYGTSGMPGDASGKETNLEQQYFFIPNLYLTSKISDRFSLGVGLYNTFGLCFEWPDTFEGRFAPGGKKGQLETLTLSPVLAYNISKALSIAAGGRLQKADLQLENKIFIAPGVDEVNSKISGDDYAAAWYAAILYRITDYLSAGLNYRSQMKHSFDDLDVEFTPQIANIGPIPVGLANTKAKLDVTLPQYVSLGLAWTPGPLTITADAYWWNWSKIENLNFQFDAPVAGQTSMQTPMNWKDTWTWALGVEYRIKAWERVIKVRGGFMYEQSPVPDETVNPVGYQGDNLLYNIGLGSAIGPVAADLYFTYVYTKDRTWNNATGNAPNPGGGPITGEFKDYNSFIIGANITYKF